MPLFNVKGRYTDKQGRSHYFKLVSDCSDCSFMNDLVRAQYPAEKVYINIVNQDLR